MNKVTLKGRIGKVENKVLQNGTNVSKIALATNKKYKDESGEWQEKTAWHDVTVYGYQAEKIAQYMEKGDMILIDGEMQNQSWENDAGEKRYRYFVNAKLVEKIMTPKKDEQQSQATQSNYAQKRNHTKPSQRQIDTQNAHYGELVDDSIPF